MLANERRRAGARFEEVCLSKGHLSLERRPLYLFNYAATTTYMLNLDFRSRRMITISIPSIPLPYHSLPPTLSCLKLKTDEYVHAATKRFYLLGCYIAA
ncbi:hypothetical protein B0H10DRAFT_1006574 [Mycena sp. CBHHK59/15]|nr:hypothetical protein B0H10DRAFT_1006574 [Mycena sp. CBHHK59/15]